MCIRIILDKLLRIKVLIVVTLRGNSNKMMKADTNRASEGVAILFLDLGSGYT